MGNHTSCIDWDYEKHPQRKRITKRCDLLGRSIITQAANFSQGKYGFDTRPGHRFIFRGMAPAACSCLIGNYRGLATCPELVNLIVRMPADPRVGVGPQSVSAAIAMLEQHADRLIAEFQQWKVQPGSTPGSLLLQFVDVLADVLEAFFTIHPYANGNGHCGRLLVWTLIAREGFKPRRWTIDQKQPYSDALRRYRDGDWKPLRKYLLRLIRN